MKKLILLVISIVLLFLSFSGAFNVPATRGDILFALSILFLLLGGD